MTCATSRPNTARPFRLATFTAVAIALVSWTERGMAQDGGPEPATPETTTFTAHNRADAAVELWAGRTFLGRIRPGETIVRRTPIERREGDGALAVIGIGRHEPGSDYSMPTYRAAAVVLPGVMAASDEFSIVWGGLEPLDDTTPRVMDDPGEHTHGVLRQELWLAAEGHRAGAPLPSSATRIGTTFGESVVLGGVLAVHRTPRDEADEKDGRDSYVANEVGMLLVRIPAGSFEPGTFQRGQARPTVTLTQDYYMSVTETTNAHLARSEAHGKTADLPALQLTWDRAMEWCSEMDDIEGWAYTLPTEAQWERACQAGRLQPFSPAGQPADKIMWWFENSGQQPQPVAQLLPNDFGIFDMHGNAMEWGRDWAYMRQPMSGVDPTGVPKERAIRSWDGDPERVRRGGAFDSRDHRCSCGKRDSSTPGLVMHFQGFRPVLIRE